MTECILTPLILRPAQLRESQRRRSRQARRAAVTLGLLLLVALGRPAVLPASNPVLAPESNPSGTSGGGSESLTAIQDSVYDRFLQGFRHLRTDAARRRYLAREIVRAATHNQVDPDLLFAVVAMESEFNSMARSAKGARGLGQIMFTTTHAVAPQLVRRPNDLYNVRRNLSVTAFYLRRLLIESDGDLQEALAAYHYGPAEGHPGRRGESLYVGRICTYFASLKARQDFQVLAMRNPEDTRSVEAGLLEN